ncbi:glutamine amidotransferase [Candidatus Bipolaricaulota bacterium]|nr:glutamine amidotransferase [Candidatus Bipolaricaulota bacterium]
MCGIVGIIPDKSRKVGKDLIEMLNTLQHRGTDSAGVAVYQEEFDREDTYRLVAEVMDKPGSFGGLGNAIGGAGGDIRNISFRPSPHGEKGLNICKLRVPGKDELGQVIEKINSSEVANVYSYGKSVQVIKDLGLVEDLERGYNVSSMSGTHGIGHVRFSTESGVDRKHAHPFHTEDLPDISVVHNGQITNHYKVRGELERKGFSFSSDNDSEVIVYFIADQLRQDRTLKEALKASVEVLDGPFSYLVATSQGVGVARDKLGLRPMAWVQGDKGKYVASEEVALMDISNGSEVEYFNPGEVRVFEQTKN